MPPNGRHRSTSVSRHPGPLSSCAKRPPQGRSLPRAFGCHEAKVADAEFFIRRECISGAGLFQRSMSFALPTCRSPTSPTPVLTPPPATHRRPRPPKTRHRRLLTSVSTLHSTTPKLVHCLISVLLVRSPLHLVASNRRDRLAATAWEAMVPSPVFYDHGPKGLVDPKP
jgi:hypothetical protein